MPLDPPEMSPVEHENPAIFLAMLNANFEPRIGFDHVVFAPPAVACKLTLFTCCYPLSFH